MRGMELNDLSWLKKIETFRLVLDAIKFAPVGKKIVYSNKISEIVLKSYE
jgi:hypothetical protein